MTTSAALGIVSALFLLVLFLLAWYADEVLAREQREQR